MRLTRFWSKSDQILVEVVARVSNIAANASGDLLTNRARLTYDGNNTLDASAAADVVEPNLNIDKTANPTTGLNAGDTITYTLVIDHTAVAPISRADAFDLRITDVLPTGVTYGSVTAATSTCDDRAGWSADVSGLPGTVIYRFDDPSSTALMTSRWGRAAPSSTQRRLLTPSPTVSR